MKPVQKIRKISASRMLCIMLCILYILMTDTVCASVLRIDRQSGRTGQTIRFAVSAADVPNAVEALGFEVVYDATVLRFRGFVPGSLTQDFTNFSASNTDFGTVRVGGFDAGDSHISQGASGVLAFLEFEVVGEKSCEVQIQNLLDDVKDWSVSPGSFSGNSAGEDVNADDAQQAEADLNEQTESEKNTSAAEPDSSAQAAWNPLENAASSLDSSPASFPDGAEENREMPMPETGKTGQSGENLREKQRGKNLSPDMHRVNSPDSEKDTEKKAAAQIPESENRKLPGLSDINNMESQNVHADSALTEMEKSPVNPEMENCKPGIWHWMMFAVLLLILGIQILILWQVMNLKKR